MARGAAVRQAAWYLVRNNDLETRLDGILEQLENNFSYPMFVKPAGTGSSVGVSKAANREGLAAALCAAAKFDSKILGVCGTKSGRDTDKIKELNLTLEEGMTVSVPAIKELPLTLECKVIYKQDQDPNAVNEENTARYYPEGDYHTAYYGQIMAAYIIE